MTEQEAVAEALQSAGVCAPLVPGNRSGELWNMYRMRIAQELIKQGIGVIDRVEGMAQCFQC